MKRLTLALSLLIAPIGVQADTPKRIVETHILPRFETLADRAQALADVAAADCDPSSDGLRLAYGSAFDAWIDASHLRFGPTEINDRAFALAFWPDSRGATPKALAGMIDTQDDAAFSVTDYAHVSIAARGYYAMEFLLFDATLMSEGDAFYHCALVQTISADIAVTTKQIADEWQSDYATTMLNPTPNGVYHTEDEVLQELFKSLATGLQFTQETRLGRPLGTFDRPRPTRAEAWRSGRSSRHVMLSLTALRDLAAQLAGDDAALAAALDTGFERAQSQLSKISDPVFADLEDPQARFSLEVVQQSVTAIQSIVRDQLGPTLGVAAGFNALDGD